MKKTNVRFSIMSISIVLFAILAVCVAINAEAFYATLNTLVMDIGMYNFGWTASLTCTFIIIFLIFAMVSPMGKIKLGGPNAKPKFSYLQWFGISLCTAISSGVLFWGVAQPLIFTFQPNPSEHLIAGSNEAVIFSMVHSFMTWALSPYCTCVATGLVLSYVILNKRAPFRPSSLLIPIFGMKIVGTKLATAFDALSAFAILGAVAGHMGYGSMQIAWTTKLLFGLEPSMLLYMGIIAILFAGDILTAAKGLQKGIAKLSDINTDLFFALLLFVFLAGPSTYIINLFLHSTGEYLNNFLANSLYTAPFLDSGNWAQSWDMYWLIDWMAFAPLLGLFMVRVSYGRSVREFIMIEWILPALFGMVWFSIFGGTALYEQLTGAFDYWAVYLSDGAEALTMTLLGNLPFGKVIQVVVLVVLLISLITQGNSMILSLSSMSLSDSNENTEAPLWLKLFWGILIAVVAAVFTILGGIDGIKTVHCFCGIPLTVIVFAVMLGFVVYMSKVPRKENGEYLPEPEIANAPDNGEPMNPDGAFSLLIKRIFRKRDCSDEVSVK